MDKVHTLMGLGLSETESNIYLCLLRDKNISAVKIAKETGIHRRTVYDNLEMLLKKGLASFKIDDGIKHFSANNPGVLKTCLEEKMSTLDAVMPLLMQEYGKDNDGLKIQVLKGKQSAKMIMDDVIASGDTLLWLGGRMYFLDYFRYSKAFVKSKLSKIRIRMIQPDVENIESKMSEICPVESRIIPARYKSPVGFAVYGNKVALGTLETQDVTMILIENKAFSDAFRNYFEIIWSFAEKD